MFETEEVIRSRTTLPFLKILSGAGHYLLLPVLTTAQRDALTAATGYIIYNSTTTQIENYNGSAWVATGKVYGDATFLPLAGGTMTGAIDFGSQVATNTFELYRALRREMALGRWHGTNATQVVSGSGATEITEDEAYAHTGATHASTAGRYYPTYFPSAANPNGINWGKKFFIAFSVIWRGVAITNLTIRLQITQATTIGNLTAHGLGMETNGANINLATYGTGGSQQLVSAATNLVDDQRAFILIEHDPASADRLYINGVLGASQSTAANIPSTDPAATYYMFCSVARSGGADIDDEGVRFGNFEWGHEF